VFYFLKSIQILEPTKIPTAAIIDTAKIVCDVVSSIVALQLTIFRIKLFLKYGEKNYSWKM